MLSGCDRPDQVVIDVDADGLQTRLKVGPLRGAESDRAGTRCHIHALADRAVGSLQEGDLIALGRVGVAAGEAAAVAGQAGRAGKGPWRAAWVVGVSVRTAALPRRLETWIERLVDVGTLNHDLVDEGGIVAAAEVQANELNRYGCRRTG